METPSSIADSRARTSDLMSTSSTDDGEQEPITTGNRQMTTPLDSRFSCNICLEAVTEPVVTQCGHLYCWPCLYRWLEPGILPFERDGLLAGITTTAMGLTRGRGAAAAVAVDESRRCCPVCKAECSVATLVPIYVRNEPSTPRQQHQRRGINVQRQHSTTTEATSRSQDHVESVATVGSASGTRRRVRYRSRDDSGGVHTTPNRSEGDDTANVPSRPAASTPPRRHQRDSVAARNNTTPFIASMSPTPHRPSLSHGLAPLSFWHAVFGGGEPSLQPSIPPLHRRQEDPNNNPVLPQNVVVGDQTTEFLSRLLLMLGSFVILCLLLF